MNNKSTSSNCSVVILSYNVKSITDICISKAIESKKYSEKTLKNKIDLIVVDNGSTDGTAAMIRKKYKGKVQLIAKNENLGVSKGYNIGMRAAKTPYILIINSDTYLHKETLAKSTQYMNKHKQTDVLMVQLTNLEGKFHPYGGHVPTPLKIILWQLGFESLPVVKQLIPRIYCYNDAFYTQDSNMEWAPTCYFFMRREVFDKTGGHDENIFLYMDDLEWCKRIKDHGFTITFTPTIQTVHLGGESTEKKMESSYLLQRQTNGLIYYIKKHYPQYETVLKGCLRAGFLARASYYFLRGKPKLAKAYVKIRI